MGGGHLQDAAGVAAFLPGQENKIERHQPVWSGQDPRASVPSGIPTLPSQPSKKGPSNFLQENLCIFLDSSKVNGGTVFKKFIRALVYLSGRFNTAKQRATVAKFPGTGQKTVFLERDVTSKKGHGPESIKGNSASGSRSTEPIVISSSMAAVALPARFWVESRCSWLVAILEPNDRKCRLRATSKAEP